MSSIDHNFGWGNTYDHICRHLGSAKLASVDVPAVRRIMAKIEADTWVNSRKRRLGGRASPARLSACSPSS